jgi:hypothetical protein
VLLVVRGCLMVGGLGGWLWAGWAGRLAVAAVRGCGYGGCEPGRMPGGWVLSKIAVAGALEGWPGGCMAVTWLRPGWLTG